MKIPSPVKDYVLDTVYADTLFPVMQGSLPPFVESTRFGKEQAISFSYARNIRISRITWIGKVAADADITDATFTLRFYENEYTDTISTPAESAATEHFVKARAELLHADDTGEIYRFIYEDYAMFNEGAGSYWLAILDAEVDNINVTLAAMPHDYDELYTGRQRQFAGSWTDQTRPIAVKLEGGPPVEQQQ